MPFSTKLLPTPYDLLAPDGSEVRLLLGLNGGGMAHFQLPAGQISRAVRHRTVEEIWYILEGKGEIWRSVGGTEVVSPLFPGVCLTIPVGTAFQFRASPDTAVSIVAVTMPPWPGENEAEYIAGAWPAST